MARTRDDDVDDDDYDDRPSRRGTPPPNYLVFAILSTLCCCIPGGIVSIIYSTQVNSKWAAGDAAGARKASESAKMWAMISAGVGIVVNIIAVVVQMMLAKQAGN